MERLYYLSVIERPVSADEVTYRDYVDTTVLDREWCGHDVGSGNTAKDIRITENVHADERLLVEGATFCSLSHILHHVPPVTFYLMLSR